MNFQVNAQLVPTSRLHSRWGSSHLVTHACSTTKNLERNLRHYPLEFHTLLFLHSFDVNVAAALYKLSVLGAKKKLVASPFIPQELCLKYGLSHQPCDSKLHLLIASPNLVQNRSPNSSFQQRGLHNLDTTNIANERMACARSGPKNKTRPMATESEGQLELRRVPPTQNTI